MSHEIDLEQPTESLYDETLPATTRRRSLVLLGVCCLGFLLFDLAVPSLFDNGFSAMVAMGGVTAQVTLICVWGAMVQGTFWIRLPWSLLLVVISWCALALGATLEFGRFETDVAINLGVLWVFGVLTSIVPLKIAAVCFRWRITQHVDDSSSGRTGSCYAIRDIMIGTFLLALSLAVVRAMLPVEFHELSSMVEDGILSDSELLFLLAVYGVLSLAVKLPCIWISLGRRAKDMHQAIFIWVLYCLVLSIIEIVIVISVLGTPSATVAAEFYAGVILGKQLMGAILLGIGFALRGQGYRLERAIGT